MNNTLAILNMYREKGVAAVRTPAGVRFMGTAHITKEELAMLNRLSQPELEAALKWQK